MIGMKSHHKIYLWILLIFLCQKVMSTECVRLFSPFKSTIKGAEIAVVGEIICYDEETSTTFVKVTERFFGYCQDTIRCIDFVFTQSNHELIVLLYKLMGAENSYRLGECGSFVLFFNAQKNKFSGNITHFNGLICRTLAFFHIYKLPTNHMNYQRIERIVKRKSKNRDFSSS